MKESGYWDTYILNGNLFSTVQYDILVQTQPPSDPLSEWPRLQFD